MNAFRAVGPEGPGQERQRELLEEAVERRVGREVLNARCQRDRAGQEGPHDVWRISLGGWTLALKRTPRGNA